MNEIITLSAKHYENAELLTMVIVYLSTPALNCTSMIVVLPNTRKR